MKTLLLLVTAFFALNAYAVPIDILSQNIKLPTQAVLEHETITTPVAAGTSILNNVAGPTSAAATTITSFSAQPDVPRNLTITPGGTTGDVENCAIVVRGTSISGNSISETFSFLANATEAVVGTKAFKTVVSVGFAAGCESGGFAATWYMNFGTKFGLNRCAANAGALAWSVFDGAFEATRGTMTADADEMEKNLFVPNGSPNGAKNIEVYYVQNFGCFE